ncbi:MAG: glycosyltransferase, partial [Gemmatimonadales bacterium]|nr:glycosyltransferase [Gemmatimonadales bacterium]NIN48518.1 glycosyltransferase [Gemmatimonadales bacterium]NIP05982.1 glycosyltransferase [Gemmatimonadales bacterium]NIQ99934.1 glycosyltransferase [Gemmatimonadales bacterium]NIS64393.1 glycosyltransferase [Gemmatimonadales bacterium]
QVTLVGEVHDIAAFLYTTEIVVLPSLTNEGMPNAVIEAMAAAKPVVATAIGGTPDVVDDSVTGFLIPPKDPAALADRIGRLCSEPSLRRAMGGRGRARVRERFSSGRMAADYIRLCAGLLDAGGGPQGTARRPSDALRAAKWTAPEAATGTDGVAQPQHVGPTAAPSDSEPAHPV